MHREMVNKGEKRDKWTIVYGQWRGCVSRVGIRGGGGVSKSHTFKGLVKVGASKGVLRVDLKKSWPGGFPGNQKTTLDTPLYRGPNCMPKPCALPCVLLGWHLVKLFFLKLRIHFPLYSKGILHNRGLYTMTI